MRSRFFLGDMSKRVQETPRYIRVPIRLSPGGRAGVPPSAPLLHALKFTGGYVRDGESINRDKERQLCDPEVASSNPGRGKFLSKGRFCLF